MVSEEQVKRCSSCKEDKPLTEFNKDKRRKDGTNCYCRLCAVAKYKQWCEEHPARAKEINRNYYLKNIEKAKERARTWHKKNPASSLASSIKWRKTNPEKYKEVSRKTATKYRESHPEWFLWQAAKRRAKVKGLPFDIDPDDVVIPPICPILGIVLCRNKGGNSAIPQSPSIDKIVPQLGYVKENIIVISHRANVMKHNANLEELILIGKWAEKQKSKASSLLSETRDVDK